MEHGLGHLNSGMSDFGWTKWLVCWLIALAVQGCGATKARTATEQLLMSDALDRAVAQIDFSALARQKVYFDTKFIQTSKDPVLLATFKGIGYVNAEYAISALRQQMVAAGLLLQDKMEDAEYVVEARLGAVGTDNNEVIFGVPATNVLSTATSVVPNSPPVPAIPEIALAKKNVLIGAAKIGVFAYHQKSRAAVWQSGISKATSTARDTWVFGAGPFQRGTIYDGTQFAGSSLAIPIPSMTEPVPDAHSQPHDVQVSYYDEFFFGPQPSRTIHAEVIPAGFDEPANITSVPTQSSATATPAGSALASPPLASPPPASPPPASTPRVAPTPNAAAPSK